MGRVHGDFYNMGDNAAEIKALMGQFFEVIDVDGSGAIEEKEIKAAVLALFESIGMAKTEEEQGAILGGALFFCAGLSQLNEKLGEDSTSCSREAWDAFEMTPIEGVPEEDFVGGLICFLGLVAAAVENKEVVQAKLKEVAASPDFDATFAEFEKKMGA